MNFDGEDFGIMHSDSCFSATADLPVARHGLVCPQADY